MAGSPSPARPLSPHLQIWRFTVTMAASITQRGTGVANFAGVALLALWLFSVAQGSEFFAPVGALLTSPIGGVVLAGFIWSLCFHMLNGLRYLYWDSGRGFKPATARATGWAVYIGSVALAGLVIFAGLAARGGA
jgi:succinate dehydrogenase / fumarate reductase cytochrome b subunit